jgi:hypothetical protein
VYLAGSVYSQRIHPFAFLPESLDFQVVEQNGISPKTVFFRGFRIVSLGPGGILFQETATLCTLAKNLCLFFHAPPLTSEMKFHHMETTLQHLNQLIDVGKQQNGLWLIYLPLTWLRMVECMEKKRSRLSPSACAARLHRWAYEARRNWR